MNVPFFVLSFVQHNILTVLNVLSIFVVIKYENCVKNEHIALLKNATSFQAFHIIHIQYNVTNALWNS